MIARMNKSLLERRSAMKREEGFTLIELLVVVLIIGILAAIAIPVFLGVQDNAKRAAITSDLNNAKTAVIAYYTNNPAAKAPEVADLAEWGYKKTGKVTLTFGTIPSGPGKPFCVQGSHKEIDDDKPSKHVTNDSGVEEGACGTVKP